MNYIETAHRPEQLPVVADTYDFATWSDDRLTQRLYELVDTKQLPHGEERMATISREILHIVFETHYRFEQE